MKHFNRIYPLLALVASATSLNGMERENWHLQTNDDGWEELHIEPAPQAPALVHTHMPVAVRDLEQQHTPEPHTLLHAAVTTRTTHHAIGPASTIEFQDQQHAHLRTAIVASTAIARPEHLAPEPAETPPPAPQQQPLLLWWEQIKIVTSLLSTILYDECWTLPERTWHM